jgi:two-component system sensor histidine kinase KdpD
MAPLDSAQKGRLKVLLGYAAGVGKTYRMLEEGQVLKAKNVDVVIGYFEQHGRQYTIAKSAGLEAVPRRRTEYRGSVFEDMDTEAIIRRRPQVCLVDELAHTNVPGSEHSKRWQDVLAIIDAGIDVITNLNIQHLESLNDPVAQMTGVRVRETVPDWMIRQADEVVMIDLTPRALLNRMQRGVVYAPDKAEKALANFFKESNLVALRELALRQAAHEVDVRDTTPDAPLDAGAPAARAGDERILIHITASASTAILIRRAWRVAEFLNADCLAVYVRVRSGNADQAERGTVEKHLQFARDLHIDTRIVEGDRQAETLVEFARLQKATQIFIARPHYSLWQRLFSTNLVHHMVRLAPDMRLVIVSEHRGV